MINKLKLLWINLQHIYVIYRLKKLLNEEFSYILSQEQDEALILITRWRWDLAKCEMSEKEEAAWDRALGRLEKIVRGQEKSS